ncbi:hypothetical protein KA005_83290, partial [bacterium]|nr:hypothetical protein [bacterium]
MDAYAKSKTPAGEGDKRQTPKSVVRRLQHLIGMQFDIDLCAEPHTAKAANYFTEDDDSLSLDWNKFTYTCAWLNPPYSDITPWAKKAHVSAKMGMIIVGCLPDDRSVGWYQDWVEDKAAIIYVPDKRISFEDGNGVPQKGNPKGSVF